MTFQEVEAMRRAMFLQDGRGGPMRAGGMVDGALPHCLRPLGGSFVDASGVMFQRCGGGRRVIRKRIGGARS